MTPTEMSLIDYDIPPNYSTLANLSRLLSLHSFVWLYNYARLMALIEIWI